MKHHTDDPAGRAESIAKKAVEEWRAHIWLEQWDLRDEYRVYVAAYDAALKEFVEAELEGQS